MSTDDYDITPIGYTTWRNQNIPFGIKDKDRLGHIYCIGKTGMGKSTLLQKMALSDITKGKGCGVIDPHGDVAKYLLERIPEERKKDVVYINPVDENVIAFNPLHAVHPNYHSLVASGLLSTFRKIWSESWGPRMEYILRFSLLTLLQYPYATLLDIQPLLTDKHFKEKVLEYVKDDYIFDFWRKEFDTYTPSFRNEVISPILNKMGVFISSKPLRNMLGKQVSGFRMSQVMDEQKILIANLSKGELGEDASTIIGSILVTSIQLSALYRAKQPMDKRTPFYLYVDEAHSFLSLSFADILAESRKYGLSLFLAHQYIEQINEEIRSAIFGNVGSIICFRLGANDANLMAKEISNEIEPLDLLRLGKTEIYLKIQIDGTSENFFSARTV
ncbi:MAG TPA: type IV secretion system DNA-binding domain-containing protein [Chitinophagales bacterium]|nr:type IV secretion system DNA-binding domain-containing protein [Chitinophagales bacterium]HRG27814.1 type IV secretion system DNA-binding domain-containing protein [Chitinophagales bacterium]HRG84518.1 type IV secretion system DNA-binding domain-containing protein [Chitinophagales bacterium]HRH53287.1 type IV secretion system DNA-binding domain-containing protein [Chitinophagales bacterium]